MSFRESNVEKGMVLPFTPLTMTFTDVHYYVDVPAVSHSFSTNRQQPVAWPMTLILYTCVS